MKNKLIIFSLIFIFLVSILVYLLWLRNQPKNIYEVDSPIIPTTAPVISPSLIPTQQSYYLTPTALPIQPMLDKPEDTVQAFLSSLKNSQSEVAKTLISPKAKLSSFSEVFHPKTATSESLYGKEFSYRNMRTRLETNGRVAYVELDVTLNGRPSHHFFTLINLDQGWQLMDHQVVTVN